MRIDIISAVPELLSGPFDHSIISRAKAKGLVEIFVHDLRKYGIGKHRQLDDYPYGGGAGMVLKPEPAAKAIDTLEEERIYQERIFLSPDGQPFQQALANEFSLKENILFFCGHYKGLDQRIRDTKFTKEVSIGDFVLSGGELAAAVIVDAVVRLIPGVLGDESSALSDSFQNGLLAPPTYTRPSKWEGMEVPHVLLSGHEANIEDWRQEQSLKKTQARRPDLYKKFSEEK